MNDVEVIAEEWLMLLGCMAVYPLLNIVTHHGPNRIDLTCVYTCMYSVRGSFTSNAQV
jgi:hypothetical protein